MNEAKLHQEAAEQSVNVYNHMATLTGAISHLDAERWCGAEDIFEFPIDAPIISAILSREHPCGEYTHFQFNSDSKSEWPHKNEAGDLFPGSRLCRVELLARHKPPAVSDGRPC